jgi:hypothetical protein
MARVSTWKLAVAALIVVLSAGILRAESPHIFGLHSWDWAANIEVMSHRSGWSFEANLSHQTPDVNGSMKPMTGESFTVMQRLDWTWDQTVPLNSSPVDQDTFAQQCGFWASQIKKYCRYYCIGNEMELWGPVSVADYVQAFTKVRNAIKAEQPEAMVLIGHWNDAGNMRLTIQQLGPDGYDGIVWHTGSSVPTHLLDMLDQENARPEVGVYITEWGWVRDTNPSAQSAMLHLYNSIGQSNSTRSRQVYCATWFLYKSGIGWDHFAMEISVIDKPAFAACTALGTSFNSFAANPVVVTNLVAEMHDQGNYVTCHWQTNVPTRRQLWWRTMGAASGNSNDLSDVLGTNHQISTAAAFSPNSVVEVMPSATTWGYADFGGRRFRVKTGPWLSQALQTGTDVTISWSTDWPTDSRVEYGSTAGLGQTATSAALTTSHSITLVDVPVGPLHYRILSSEPNPDGDPRLYMRSPVRTFTVRLGIPGDFDGDGDVDQEDFGHLQACLTGPGIAQTDPECINARLDDDTDVDIDDVEIFLACFGGPGMPPAATCPEL